MTIVEAAREVMRVTGRGMTANEILCAIRERNLFEFKAADPEGVLRKQLRRHCLGSPTATKSTIHFVLEKNGRFHLYDGAEAKLSYT